MEPFYVSAPGKVIIFGEHSAVYGKPAIAAALSLRAYLLATPSTDPDVITLEFPDIGLKHLWNKNEIPWKEISEVLKVENGVPQVTDDLIPEVTGLLSPVLEDLESTLHYTACHCFLYMYTNLCKQQTPSMKFCVRSTLPIGAGLGSSALTAVCLASALSLLGGHIAQPTFALKDKFGKDRKEADFIDTWSLMGEKCFHGNPSGIDNAVATHGGAVMYQRNTSTPSVKTTIRNLPPIRLVLTNTKVPRRTAELVGGVAKLNEKYHNTSKSILDAMGHLASDAYQLMVRPTFGISEEAQLRELINVNHGLLVALGVSHPALEQVKIVGDKIGATKLTGAGGGGCAITLVNDGVEEDDIKDVMKEFSDAGFETFETSLGGKGVGAISFSQTEVPDIFDPETFLAYKTRDDITDALGNLEGWRFW